MRPHLALTSFWLLSATVGAAYSSSPYDIRTTGTKAEDVQVALDRAASERARLLAVVRHEHAVVLLVEPGAGDPSTAYRAVAASARSLESALKEAAAQGFCIESRVRPSTWKNEAVVVLSRPAAQERCEIATVEAFPGSSRRQQPPSHELDPFVASGFTPVAVAAGRIVLEQRTARGAARPTQEMSLVIRDGVQSAGLQVADAARQGYEPTAFSARGRDVVIVMRASSASAPGTAMLLSSDRGLLAMQQQLNADSAAGLHLWGDAVLVSEDLVLALMVGSSRPPVTYGLLGPVPASVAGVRSGRMARRPGRGHARKGDRARYGTPPLTLDVVVVQSPGHRLSPVIVVGVHFGEGRRQAARSKD